MLNEEIFGPLLAVERGADVEEACDRVDASPFALTGGLFARNPDTVDRVIERSPVGNLYVNRAITGAMVGPPAVRRQPPLGHRTKAGGPGYLLQFVEPRVVTENTMRHGPGGRLTGYGPQHAAAVGPRPTSRGTLVDPTVLAQPLGDSGADEELVLPRSTTRSRWRWSTP